MRIRTVAGLSLALLFKAMPLAGQETNQVELLRRQLEQLQQDFQRIQDQQRQQIESLERQVRKLQENRPVEPNQPPSSIRIAAPPPSAPAAMAEGTNAPSATPEAARTWSPTNPITLFGGERNYLNLSFDGLMAAGTSTANDLEKLEPGGHDPRERGFTVQNLETVFEGKVDPYFRGQANLVMQIDPGGETTLELEEAYLETMALPGNFQVRAGQFFTEFGRLNPTHPHTWDFVDQPLVNARFFGEDGLRSAGARVSWLVPTPFYSELFLTIANSQGPTAYSFRDEHDGQPFLGRPSIERRVKAVGDMLFVPRYVVSLDLTDSQTLMAGTSAAFGPNSSGLFQDTQIYGVDLFWKWKSSKQSGGFPFVTWQTEGLTRRFRAAAYSRDPVAPALPAETVVDYGAYTEVAYGFRMGWITGLRLDYVFPEEEAKYERLLGPDPDRATRWRLSPDLTWYPSEFSKIRLQYNFDHRQLVGEDHSVWLQFEFLLGSHAAHKF